MLESWLLLLPARCLLLIFNPSVAPLPWEDDRGGSSVSIQGDGGWLTLGDEAGTDKEGLGLLVGASLGVLGFIDCWCCCFSSSLFSFSAQAARRSSCILSSSSSRRRRARSTAAEISVDDCFLRCRHVSSSSSPCCWGCRVLEGGGVGPPGIAPACCCAWAPLGFWGARIRPEIGDWFEGRSCWQKAVY